MYLRCTIIEWGGLVEKTITGTNEIRERVKAGLKSARGRKGGRPPVSEETKAMIQALMGDKSLSIKQICGQLGIAKSTLYKHAKL